MSRNPFTIEWKKKNHPKAVDTFYKCQDFYGDMGWRGGGGGRWGEGGERGAGLRHLRFSKELSSPSAN